MTTTQLYHGPPTLVPSPPSPTTLDGCRGGAGVGLYSGSGRDESDHERSPPPASNRVDLGQPLPLGSQNGASALSGPKSSAAPTTTHNRSKGTGGSISEGVRQKLLAYLMNKKHHNPNLTRSASSVTCNAIQRQRGDPHHPHPHFYDCPPSLDIIRDEGEDLSCQLMVPSASPHSPSLTFPKRATGTKLSRYNKQHSNSLSCNPLVMGSCQANTSGNIINNNNSSHHPLSRGLQRSHPYKPSPLAASKWTANSATNIKSSPYGTQHHPYDWEDDEGDGGPLNGEKRYPSHPHMQYPNPQLFRETVLRKTFSEPNIKKKSGPGERHLPRHLPLPGLAPLKEHISTVDGPPSSPPTTHTDNYYRRRFWSFHKTPVNHVTPDEEPMDLTISYASDEAPSIGTTTYPISSNLLQNGRGCVIMKNRRGLSNTNLHLSNVAPAWQSLPNIRKDEEDFDSRYGTIAADRGPTKLNEPTKSRHPLSVDCLVGSQGLSPTSGGLQKGASSERRRNPDPVFPFSRERRGTPSPFPRPPTAYETEQSGIPKTPVGHLTHNTDHSSQHVTPAAGSQQAMAAAAAAAMMMYYYDPHNRHFASHHPYYTPFVYNPWAHYLSQSSLYPPFAAPPFFQGHVTGPSFVDQTHHVRLSDPNVASSATPTMVTNLESDRQQFLTTAVATSRHPHTGETGRVDNDTTITTVTYDPKVDGCLTSDPEASREQESYTFHENRNSFRARGGSTDERWCPSSYKPRYHRMFALRAAAAASSDTFSRTNSEPIPTYMNNNPNVPVIPRPKNSPQDPSHSATNEERTNPKISDGTGDGAGNGKESTYRLPLSSAPFKKCVSERRGLPTACDAQACDYNKLESKQRLKEAILNWVANKGPTTTPSTTPSHQPLVAPKRLKRMNHVVIDHVIEGRIPPRASFDEKRARLNEIQGSRAVPVSCNDSKQHPKYYTLQQEQGFRSKSISTFSSYLGQRVPVGKDSLYSFTTSGGKPQASPGLPLQCSDLRNLSNPFSMINENTIITRRMVSEIEAVNALASLSMTSSR